MQGRKKELLLQASVAMERASNGDEEAKVSQGEQDGAKNDLVLFSGLGCNETEFRLLLAHVTGDAKAAAGVTVDELYVDLSNQTLRADLRDRWSARRLVLKDKSFKKSMASDESLVGDIKGYLTRMQEFDQEGMTGAELVDWLRASWCPPPPADDVASLMFAPARTVNETGLVRFPLKHAVRWLLMHVPHPAASGQIS